MIHGTRERKREESGRTARDLEDGGRMRDYVGVEGDGGRVRITVKKSGGRARQRIVKGGWRKRGEKNLTRV
jgi:hypothetical protein